MMVNGYSKNALDYLIWACISMESSVPLMMKKYLPWRCQLYTTVCHCYYDVNLALDAENFARRGLKKVNKYFLLNFIYTISLSFTALHYYCTVTTPLRFTLSSYIKALAPISKYINL